jgi:hypothetical protein
MTVRKFLLSLLIRALPAIAVAVATAGDEDRPRDKTVTISDGEESINISIVEGPILRIVTDNGDEDIVEIDLSQLDEIVDGAMDDVADALDELSDFELDLHLGESSTLSIFDGEDEFYLNISEIMEQAGEVLADALDEISLAWDDETADSRERWSEADSDRMRDEAEELRQEVERLRAEIVELQKELRRTKQRRHH